MHKLTLLSLVALSFGGCYTQLKSDGDYWGYTGRAKRDKVVIIKERTDTVVVTSQDTVVSEPAVEPEPEKTIIINNYYPEYSIYAPRSYWYDPWGPHVSFSITFGAPYPYYYAPVYLHPWHYWHWWDRPWFWDPVYYRPYAGWYDPYWDPWWGWYNPYTCLRPSYYPYWDYGYYDPYYRPHYTSGDGDGHKGSGRRRGRIGGEDRAGNSISATGRSSSAGKTSSTTGLTTTANGRAIKSSNEPPVEIVTDNSEGVRSRAAEGSVPSKGGESARPSTPANRETQVVRGSAKSNILPSEKKAVSTSPSESSRSSSGPSDHSSSRSSGPSGASSGGAVRSSSGSGSGSSGGSSSGGSGSQSSSNSSRDGGGRASRGAR